MADIGYVMYLIIICIFFKVIDYQDTQKIIEYFKKDGTYIQEALVNIQKDYKNYDSYYVISNVCANDHICFAKYIPSVSKYDKIKNKLFTTDDKSYIFSIKERCKYYYDVRTTSSEVCYIDVKDNKLREYMRVYLYREEYRKEFNLPPGNYRIYSKNLINNGKTIGYIY